MARLSEDIMYIGTLKSLMENKCDSELQDEILHNARLINSLPMSPSPSDVVKAEDWLAHSKAARELLDERKEKRAQKKQALEEWKNDQEAEKYRCALNLPWGTSANGQLVAAILEDEAPRGLTAEEIGGWCEELSQLEEAELDTLLGGLTREGVLSHLGDKYYLKDVVTADFYPDFAYGWCEDKIRSNKLRSGEYLGHRLFLSQLINFSDVPLSREDVEQELKLYQESTELQTAVLEGTPEITPEVFTMDKYLIGTLLAGLADDGVLDSVEIDAEGSSDTYYAVHRMGRKAPGKTASFAYARKQMKRRYMTATQRENEELKDAILDYLASHPKQPLQDIATRVPEIRHAFQNSPEETRKTLAEQKVSSLLKQMLEEKTVTVEEEDHKSVYSVSQAALSDEELKDLIYEIMSANAQVTVFELMQEAPELKALTATKVTQLVYQLKDAGLVERFEVKRKPYFRLTAKN